MKNYIGCKVIKAEPMNEDTFLKIWKAKTFDSGKARDGYRVIYPDGYVSWSPKDVFESAYREFSEAEVSFLNSQLP